MTRLSEKFERGSLGDLFAVVKTTTRSERAITAFITWAIIRMVIPGWKFF